MVKVVDHFCEGLKWKIADPHPAPKRPSTVAFLTYKATFSTSGMGPDYVKTPESL